MLKIRVIPTRKMFYSDEDAYGIYAVEINEKDLEEFGEEIELNSYKNISIKGYLPPLDMKSEYQVSLVKDPDGKFAGSYLVESIRQDKPETVQEQKLFFGMILSEFQVENIFKVYDGEDIIGMIQNDTFDWTKVHGIGKITYDKMKEKVVMNLEMSELLVFLGKHGIKFNMIKKLIAKYKNPQVIIKKIEDNPYILTEVRGIGFKTADDIARAMGFDLTSPFRIDAALRYVVEEENMNGHSWVDRKNMLNKSITLLSLKRKMIEERLDAHPEGILKVDENTYSITPVYKAEMIVTNAVNTMKEDRSTVFKKEEIDDFLADYCERHNVELEEKQHQFFHDWNENRVLLLVGGGGMGKSWLQKILIEMIQTKKKGYRIQLLAPTGRASKVMMGYTGMDASTIHRRIGIGQEGSDNPRKKYINEDFVIVDESSMCDVFVLASLFEAITNKNCRVLFVGDDFQLPSVGVGNFLYDMINSYEIKVSQLQKVFRQEEGGILDIITKVRRGEIFLSHNATGRKVFGNNCVFWLVDSEHVKEGVLTNYKKALKKYKPEEIAILTPTNKGLLGTVSLNKAIQEIVNPHSETKKEIAVGKSDNPTYFRVGDLVMNTANAYEIGTLNDEVVDIYNGDIGKVIDIIENEDKTKSVVVDFDGMHVPLSSGYVMTSLTHAWVTTIHKSQGSQYPVVIAVMDSSMKYQLNANLIYTGWSRVQQYLLVIGQAEAINFGMKRFINMDRRSFLKVMLKQTRVEILLPLAIYEQPDEIKEKLIVEEKRIIEEKKKAEPDKIVMSIDEAKNRPSPSQKEKETKKEIDWEYYL